MKVRRYYYKEVGNNLRTNELAVLENWHMTLVTRFGRESGEFNQRGRARAHTHTYALKRYFMLFDICT